MIHPSQTLRDRLRASSRKSVVIASLGALVAAGAVALPLTGVTPTAIGQVLRDPMSILERRSPGVRQVGLLTKVKRARKSTRLAGPAGPRQRVLSPARTPAGPGLAGAPISFADSVVPIPFTSFTDAVPLLGAPGGFLPVAGPLLAGGGIVVPPVFGGGVVAPPGGGGGGGGVVVPPDTVTPPPTTPPPPTGGEGVVPPVLAVPEPATWVTMMLGFGVIGGMLRRRRARPVAAAAR